MDSKATGVLEGVAPQPATNREFTASLCRALGVFESLAAPPWAIQTLFGERAAIVLGSTRLEPSTPEIGAGTLIDYRLKLN